MGHQRGFWVVSPNVNARENLTEIWRHEILRRKAAFMGWGMDHPIGQRFASRIKRGDIILIARRHKGQPQVVGFGTATGRFEWFQKGQRARFHYGSIHKLKPFRPLSRAPKGVQLIDALNHTMALVKLHPSRDEKHKTICDWMEKELAADSRLTKEREANQTLDPRLKELRHQDESEYQVRRKGEIAIARRDEARLLNEYIEWLKLQGRKLHIANYRNLRCDAFEEDRLNLIEAKRDIERGHIRMAVGQLLDYAYQGREHFRKPHLAILLPRRPSKLGQLGWLSENEIHLIWKEGNVFLDDCDGQFT